MSSRPDKVASLLQREISRTIQRDLSDPRIEGMVSITQVKVSDDLREATVHVSVLPREHETKVIAALKDATRHIQKVTQPRVALRAMPRLTFRLDESLKKQADVLAAIHEANDRTGSTGSPQAGPTPPSDPQEPLR